MSYIKNSTFHKTATFGQKTNHCSGVAIAALQLFFEEKLDCSVLLNEQKFISVINHISELSSIYYQLGRTNSFGDENDNYENELIELKNIFNRKTEDQRNVVDLNEDLSIVFQTSNLIFDENGNVLPLVDYIERWRGTNEFMVTFFNFMRSRNNSVLFANEHFVTIVTCGNNYFLIDGFPFFTIAFYDTLENLCCDLNEFVGSSCFSLHHAKIFDEDRDANVIIIDQHATDNMRESSDKDLHVIESRFQRIEDCKILTTEQLRSKNRKQVKDYFRKFIKPVANGKFRCIHPSCKQKRGGGILRNNKSVYSHIDMKTDAVFEKFRCEDCSRTFRSNVFILFEKISSLIDPQRSLMFYLNKIYEEGQSYEDVEVCLFIISCFISKVDQSENSLVSKLIQSILRVDEHSVEAISYMSIKIIKNLSKWLNYHQEYLLNVLNFLHNFLLKGGALASVAAESIAEICCDSKIPMQTYMNELFELLSNLGNFSLPT
ncbi:hypothetical protein PVAND_012805 [Polypedilum vanderplanki]|uniref:Uncharacterized protein n=1 Tax=Polypedilum vanderplanki TaxID=319348 RepID=A0A9J6CPI3_POLVA|nr:hypothetical protein PVAND_012805 [Polypedilum vanderplanki]